MNEEISTSWHSYPKIFSIGHRAIRELTKYPVIIEEKVDGSQFSFGVFDGEIKCRSKGAVLNIVAPEKMFIAAVETVQRLASTLHAGWTYRGEYLQKPKHNTLAYGRIPAQHIIGFDICTGHETYMPYVDKRVEFERIGLETVPCLFEGVVEDEQKFRALLSAISALGGNKVEGVVVKQKDVTLFGPDGKALIGKFVSEDFKEIHANEWKESNPGQGDILERLVAKYTTPARWAKSVQHLRESGVIQNAPQDIGPALKEIQRDIERECAEEIKDQLWEWAKGQILRGAGRGFPLWYKEQLLKAQFEEQGA